jgi:hypothetical protein
MADHPSRRGPNPGGEETGWGSPMPAEYGSLTAFLPPLEETRTDERGADRRSTGRRSGDGNGQEPRGRSRREAPPYDGSPPSGNGSSPPSGRATDLEAAAALAVAAPAVRDRRRPADGGTGPETADDPDLLPGRSLGRDGEGEPLDPQGSPGRRERRARGRWAQSRRAVRHLDVWTVAKVSLIFYLLVLVAVVAASVLLWYVADAFGSVDSIEKSIRTLFDLSKFTLHPSSVAVYTALGGAALAVCGTVANILAALTYNLISDLVGGIRFDVVDDAE